MTRLLEYNLEITYIISRNTDRPRNYIYKQKIEETTNKRRNQTLQNSSLLSINKRISRANQLGDQKILTKIYKS